MAAQLGNVGVPVIRGTHMGKLVRTAFWLAAFICASVASAVQAGSRNLADHGGDGGSSFTLDCGDEQVLIGVRVRRGD